MTLWSEAETANPELKIGIFKRLIRAREDGVTAGEIERRSGGKVTIHSVYDMLDAKKIPVETWEAMDETLRHLGY